MLQGIGGLFKKSDIAQDAAKQRMRWALGKARRVGVQQMKKDNPKKIDRINDAYHGKRY